LIPKNTKSRVKDQVEIELGFSFSLIGFSSIITKVELAKKAVNFPSITALFTIQIAW
jgi:hypothetical protein